jgi:hypothetical protein
MPRRTLLKSALLDRIVEHFLNSGDFNGIPLGALIKDLGPRAIEATKDLIKSQLVEVVSADWDNPHIKRLPARPIDIQLEVLGESSGQTICVYPGAKHMKRIVPGHYLRNRPFSRLLALGYAHLHPLFFELAVLERYQLDPRYVFKFDGLDGNISITAKHFRSRSLKSSDKVIVQSFGLGSDARDQRVAVVFLRYLTSISPKHQQHWQSHRLTGRCTVESNYFRRSVFGEWTNGTSVYDALLAELSHINAMCHLIGIPVLFRNDFQAERPKGFGLLMRPTSRAYFEFAHILDKIFSENLNREFFEAEGLDMKEKLERHENEYEIVTKRTIRLIEEWLAKRIRLKNGVNYSPIVKPFKVVRGLREKPAHTIVDDEFSMEFQRKKEKLITDLYISVSNIRMFFQTHPRTRNYTVPENISQESIVVY